MVQMKEEKIYRKRESKEEENLIQLLHHSDLLILI